MDKIDQYKRMMRLLIAALEILLETICFAVIWFGIYNERMRHPFENKGNIMMVGFYAFYLLIFVYLYGGM